MHRLKNIALIATLTLGFSAVSHAQSITVNFDDLSPGSTGSFIAPGYQDLTWNNFKVYTPNTNFQDGFVPGVVSPNNAAFNFKGDDAGIGTAEEGFVFSLGSAYFTPAYRDGLNIDVIGQNNGITIYTTTFTLSSTTAPTLETFNWSNLTSVTFHAYGGTPIASATTGQTTQFAIDQTTITLVPEPVTWAGLAVAFVGVGSMVRARRKSA
jgi:hypothetical protein